MATLEKCPIEMFIRLCSIAQLIAAWLNDQITTDEYFAETKRRDELEIQALKG